MRNAPLAFVAPAAFSAPAALGQTANTNFEPFPRFFAGLSAAHVQDFARHPGAAVRDTVSFEEMRHYLLTLYTGVSVQHSFALDTQVFDCVPVMQQPGVRMNGITAMADPPAAPPPGAA